jgi:hypothetical protein
MNSKGESFVLGEGGRRRGVGISKLVVCWDGAFVSGRAAGLPVGDSPPLPKKLGIGSEAGAGEAWNVAPAKTEESEPLGTDDD